MDIPRSCAKEASGQQCSETTAATRPGEKRNPQQDNAFADYAS